MPHFESNFVNHPYRRDFYDTELGVKRVKNVVEVEPESAAVQEESSAAY